jgi:hypothetical protein
MGCLQTDFYKLTLVVLINVTIAALMPQYAFISLIAAVLYYRIAVLALKPLYKWSKRFSATYAAGGVASILTYAYAINEAARLMAPGSGGAVFRHVSTPGEYVA